MHLVQDLYKSTETVYICNLLKVDSHGLSLSHQIPFTRLLSTVNNNLIAGLGVQVRRDKGWSVTCDVFIGPRAAALQTVAMALHHNSLLLALGILASLATVLAEGECLK